MIVNQIAAARWRHRSAASCGGRGGGWADDWIPPATAAARRSDANANGCGFGGCANVPDGEADFCIII
jgi:hypothetical protein